jgi:hypothetical protein
MSKDLQKRGFVRRLDHLLRLHAGVGHGQRPLITCFRHRCAEMITATT